MGWFIETGRRAGRLAAVLSGCGALAGCGAAGTMGFEASNNQPSTLSALGTKLGNLVAFNELFPGSAPLPQSDTTVACPSVDVQDGTASARFFKGAGQANGDVRYGFSLNDVARECSKVGGQLQLKVGVAGRVLIGPAGEPGTFSVPIRVVVRNDTTQTAVSSQLLRVSATVAPSDTQTGFTYVTEPFSVPIVAHPDEDYTILVGFDTSAKSPDGGPPRRQRRKPHA